MSCDKKAITTDPANADHADEMSKAEILAEMEEAFLYAKKVKEGKAEGRPVEELLKIL